MLKSAKGKNKIAYPKVAYPIQTVINPQNIKEIEDIKLPTLLIFKLLAKIQVKIPASNGCKRTRIPHASTNEKMKNKILNGEKTAD